MKYQRIKLTFLRTLLAFALLLNAETVFAQVTKNMWVGESFTCDATSAVMGLTSDISWSSNGGYFSLSGSGFYRNVTVTQYFSGTATITCTWKYRLYSSDTPRTQRKSWTFSCQSNDVIISPTSMTLAVGETGRLGYRHTYSNSYTYAANAYFSTSSTCISLNEQTGEVTALKAGTAYVNVYSKISGPQPYCVITVKDVPPTGVSLPSNLVAYVGETTKITPTLTPSNANTTFTWYCSPSNVATISNGTLTGVGEGTASVYCVTGNGLTSQSCQVSVLYRKATGIKVSEPSLYLPIGNKRTLSWTPVPSNAKTSVTWESSNPSVATVTQSGLVTGVKAGKANITVTTDNGYSATCTVTVPPNASSISIPSTFNVIIGNKATLPVTVTPEDAYYTLTWNNSTPSIASLNGTEVTALSEGSTKISCVANNGVSSNICTVKVTYPLPTSVTTDKSEIFLPIGSTEKLTYSFSPSIAKSEMTWSIENGSEKIVSVSDDGTIKGLSAGTAKVVAKTSNGLTVTYQVSVPHDPESISLSLRKVSLWVGDSRSIKIKVTPEESYFTGKWVSSNPNVVFVTQAGDVFALSPGTSDISYITNKGLSAVTKIEVPYNDLALHVLDVNGQQYTYSTNKHTVITYSNGKLNFNVEGKVQAYDAQQIRKITMLEDGDQPIPSKIAIPENLEMNCGDRRRLSYTLYPFEYDIQTTISWSSSNETVATVDNEGRISAKASGDAIITVKTGNGRRSECHVTVNEQKCYYTVILRNGNKFGYEITESPKMTYRNGNLVFTTATSEKEYPADDVWKICLIDPGVIASVGDINEDGVVNIVDIVSLIQMFIDQKNNSLNSDINNDGIVDFQDINDLENKILKKK